MFRNILSTNLTKLYVVSTIAHIAEREHINSDQEMIIRKSNQHHLSISPVLPRPRQFDALNHDDDHRHLVSETNT
ncbi:unnamed protein product [Rotaria sp. Silwood1]|nr:unnamed protein product [Rotaria sp. Silwood1]